MTKDTIVGLIALVIGGVYLASTFRVPVFDAGDATGPRVFPFLIAAVVMGCGAVLLLKDRRSADRKPFGWGIKAEPAVWLRILLTMASGIAYGLVLDWLGYLLATFFFMVVVCSFINVRRHRQNLLVAAGFSIVSFVAFGLILKLSVPRGILGAVLPF